MANQTEPICSKGTNHHETVSYSHCHDTMSAAVVHHQQNRCMRRFHDAGAVSPGTAATLGHVGVRDSLVLRYLRSRGVIVDAGGERFYLDPDAERRFRQRRFVFVVRVLAVGLIVIVVLIAFAVADAAETPSSNGGAPPIQVVKTPQFSDENGQVVIGKRLLLHLEFDPRRFAAAPGNMIDVQLLYCKNGWELVQLGSEMLHARLDAAGPQLLLSNRTRIVPGKDGNHPAR